MPEKKSSKINFGFISLSEAAKYCEYSQEYLSLRARQGKLKAEKLGRNWFTKREWVEEYVKAINEYRASNTEESSETKKIKETEVEKGDKGVEIGIKVLENDIGAKGNRAVLSHLLPSIKPALTLALAFFFWFPAQS